MFDALARRMGYLDVLVNNAGVAGPFSRVTEMRYEDVADDGIRVNVVSPGVIDTESQDRKRLADVVGTIPMKRAGQSDEVAQCVLWLASQEASYVTGAVVDASGGR